MEQVAAWVHLYAIFGHKVVKANQAILILGVGGFDSLECADVIRVGSLFTEVDFHMLNKLNSTITSNLQPDIQLRRRSGLWLSLWLRLGWLCPRLIELDTDFLARVKLDLDLVWP
jgi:hypothetical protein